MILLQDTTDCMVEGDYQMLKREYECQRKELTETRRVLEELKRENQHKNKECQKTWNSLRELQDELMRKSMHVGSLGMILSFFCVVTIFQTIFGSRAVG